MPWMVQHTQNRQNVQIGKLFVSDVYTKNMGGVDRADLLWSSYMDGRQSRKRYWCIFWEEEKRNLSCAKLLGGKLRKDIQLQQGISVDIVMLHYAKCSASLITTVQTLELKSFWQLLSFSFERRIVGIVKFHLFACF